MKSALTLLLSGDKRLLHDTCPGGGMVDALASGASTRKGVEVRVLSWAPYRPLEGLVFQVYQALRAHPETQIGTHMGHLRW